MPNNNPPPRETIGLLRAGHVEELPHYRELKSLAAQQVELLRSGRADAIGELLRRKRAAISAIETIEQRLTDDRRMIESRGPHTTALLALDEPLSDTLNLIAEIMRLESESCRLLEQNRANAFAIANLEETR